jgi:alpha-L-rhamnosidase
VLKRLLTNLEKNNHRLTTGIFGTRYLLDVLSNSGHAEIAHCVVNHRDWPGWGYMLENGATTLWEHWKFSDNTFSHNHPMFGSVREWMMRHVAGVSLADDAEGGDRFIIRPRLVDQLQWARGRYESSRGPVACHWRKKGGRLIMDVRVPVGATATVYVPTQPAGEVRESGRPIAESPGCDIVERRDNWLVLGVSSGAYQFTSER